MHSIDLPLTLALSGEKPSAELLKSFDGVGLVRGEYIFRNLLLYPTDPVAAAVLTQYVSGICASTSDRVTYRTMEVTESEANVLAGVESIDEDVENDLMGLRGVRRHIAHPDGLAAELRALGVVTQNYENLEIIAPFVTEASEYIWFRDQVTQFVGPRTEVGTMIETPAAAIDIDDFLAAGCRKFVIGPLFRPTETTWPRRGRFAGLEAPGDDQTADGRRYSGTKIKN